jgi:hypothetical protein
LHTEKPKLAHFLGTAFLICLTFVGVAHAAESNSTHDSNAPRKAAERPRRIVFITARDCPECAKQLARLRGAGGDFDNMRARGWMIGESPENDLQIIDREEVQELVERLNVREYPVVARIEDGHVIRSFKTACTTPLDAWTFGWLAKGVNERPKEAVLEAARAETTGHYPLRGNHWSIDGDWNPSKASVIAQLRGPNHGHQVVRYGNIEGWSYEELRSLHDNLHELEMGGVSSSTYRSNSSDSLSAARKSLGRPF